MKTLLTQVASTEAIQQVKHSWRVLAEPINHLERLTLPLHRSQNLEKKALSPRLKPLSRTERYAPSTLSTRHEQSLLGIPSLMHNSLHGSLTITSTLACLILLLQRQLPSLRQAV